MFLETIFARLRKDSDVPVLREIHGRDIVSFTGAELLGLTEQAREAIAARGFTKGDRCALLAPNSIRWVVFDLALLAEGLVVVPLYLRQAPAELAKILQDCEPTVVFCADRTIEVEIRVTWPSAPRFITFEEALASTQEPRVASAPSHAQTGSDPIKVIYTSGSSGEPKGVVLSASNFTHILQCTNERLDRLMGPSHERPDQIFHYAPFCFAASTVLLYTALSRKSVLNLSTDLTLLADEMKLAAPDYFLNVPQLLERVRKKVQGSIHSRCGMARAIFARAQVAYLRSYSKKHRLADIFWLSLARWFMFPTIRRSMGPNLKALICGSAPLAPETQLFFMMLGIPVLQVYGLTETTAICTLDDPSDFEPGKVGRTVPGVEMRVAENGEILVRGPNVFCGYWKRPKETAETLDGGWFHTGDQGEVDAKGNWRITGRLKNLIILNSGHNVAPEPIEQSLVAAVPDAQHVLVVGNQRSYLAALLAIPSPNTVDRERIRAAIEALNAGLPHYKKIRAFHVLASPLTPESGLLTTMGKVKREAVAAKFATEIEDLYRSKTG